MASTPFAQALENAVREALLMDVPLAERLAVVAEAVVAASPEFAAAVDRLIRRLHEAGAGDAAPALGDAMPPFLLPDETGHLLSLDRLLAEGPAVVSFHRGHWCPYCRINIASLAAIEPEVRAAGARIVAITPERRRFNAILRSDAKAPFPILTDMDNGYALALGLAVWVGDEMMRMMSAGGRDLPVYQGNDAWLLPIPATYVVSTAGTILARFVDPDYRRRMDLRDLLQAVRQARS